MFIPVPNTARFELIFTLESQRVENVYHVHKLSTSWDVTALATFADKFRVWFNASLKPNTGAHASLVLIVGTDQTTGISPRLEYTTSLPIVGTAVGDALPNNVTCAASWRTANRGRSYRGRTFHVGPTRDMVAGSALTVGAQTALQTAFAALLTAINDAEHQLCVVSRYTNHAPRAVGVSTPITSITIDSTMDSQRRRLPGRGS